MKSALDTNRLAKLLEESTRQTFVASGLPEAAIGWRAAERRMARAIQAIDELLKQLIDPTEGVLPQVAIAGRKNVEEINRAVHSLHGVMRRVWIPVIAVACLLIGVVGGDRERSWWDHRDSAGSTPVYVDYSGHNMPVRTSTTDQSIHHARKKH